MKKRMKLKNFVIPTGCVVIITILLLSTFTTFDSEKLSDSNENITYVSSIIWSNTTPVIATDAVIIKPYTNTDVVVGKYYYDFKEDSKEQENSIIFYENSYMQNSGVDYILDKSFDIINVYDGTVIKVEENELVGKTIEIKHDNNVISVYQGLNSISVKEGDVLKQGATIGKSGISKVSKELGNHLHFEIYVSGQVINPENSFGKKINEL